MLELQAQAHAEAGGAFNVDSPKQLQEILFGKLGIPVMRKTPTGQPSTAEDVLEELAASYPLPKLILEYRGVAKLKSTYTDKLPEQIDPADRAHPHLLSSGGRRDRPAVLIGSESAEHSDPHPEGRRIRQAFIAAGHSLVAADYSQIELRIMAHLSGDASLLQAFAEDRDVHQATAAEVFGLRWRRGERGSAALGQGDQFRIDLRHVGLRPRAPARHRRGEAQNATWICISSAIPGVKRYMDETRAQARETGYVETVFGRRLYLPEIRSRNQALRQYAERSAINAPMQGTAADIIKRAMIEVDAWLQRIARTGAAHHAGARRTRARSGGRGRRDAPVRQLRQHMARAGELRYPSRSM
jgi:DNA polymerase I